MSTTIDNRVVEMQFDNRQFENNVHTTLTSLDNLKKSLNFTGATKGLESIESASKGVTMSTLTSAVESIQSKFSALEVIGITTLSNITNSAINAGKRMVSALTIDPIKSGFQEYETQINAVQTILANTSSKGKTIDDVNAALDELNKYADMTIYNFTEMTRNIGTFTAAGVDLEDSVSSIKGIANLAAISGSSSQQASTAMYQLSQALASGKVALQDWNSVVNAGMGGQVFQDALKRTATNMGKNVDGMIKKYGSFRESLTEGGWLTTEVLTETLNQFAGVYSEAELIQKGYSKSQAAEIVKMAQTATDAATKVKTFTQLFDTLKEAAQSGWTQSWEIIIGDFEEAKAMLTVVSDTIGGFINTSAEARNAMLEGWKELGGRTALIEACKNAFEGLTSIITPIKDAFREIFPPITAQQLFGFTEGLKELTSHFKLSETQSANLKSTFKGLFAILDIGKQAFSAILNGILPLIGSVTGFGDGILTVTGTIGEWLVKLDQMIAKSDIFNKAIQTLSKYIKVGLDGAVNIVTNLANAFKSLSDKIASKLSTSGLDVLDSILERIRTRMEQVSAVANKLKTAFQNAFNDSNSSTQVGAFSQNIGLMTQVFDRLWSVITKVGNGIKNVCKEIGAGLSSAFEGANFDKIFDVVNGGLLAGLLVSLKGVVGGFGDALDDFGDITSNIAETLDTVRGCFEAYQQNLKAKTLLKIAAAIGILAASIVVISTIDSTKLTASLGAITVLFGELLGSLAIFSRLSGNITGVTKSVTAMMGISVSVLILASALKKVAEIDVEHLARGLVGIAGLTAIVVTAAKAMSSDTGKVMKGATSLVLFAAAIKVLASACIDLSTLNWTQLATGLTGVGVLMAEVSLFLNTAKFSGKSITTATGIVILAGAIKVLASACEDFANMNSKQLIKGLGSIGIILGELAIFSNLTGNAKHIISTGTAMVLLGASMKIFASAVEDLGNMSLNTLIKGLAAMAGALGAVTIAVNLMPKNMVAKGVGLLAVSAAINALAIAIDKMGGMTKNEIGKSLIVLGGALGILAVGLNAMNSTLPGSAALVLAAGALAVIAPTLLLLGTMSWQSITAGLVALAGAFTVIGVAGALLTPIIPSILALGGAFTLIGVGVLGIGAGLLAAGAGLAALATGFLALAGVGTAGATAIVASLAIIITGIAELIPTIIAKIGEGLVAICQVLIDSAPVICEAIVVIVTSVVKALVQTVPVLVTGLMVLITTTLQTLAKYAPDIIQAVIDILLACIKGISDNISEIVQAAIDVVLGFLDGVEQKLPEVIQAGFDLLIAFINGMTDAINNNTGVLVSAIQGLMLALINAGIQVILSGIDLFIEGGSKIIDGLITGIGKMIDGVLTCLGDLIVKMAEGIADGASDFIEVGHNLIEGLIQGIQEKFGDVVKTLESLAGDAVNTVKGIFGIHSPSRVFKNEVGKQLGAGLALGIKESSKKSTKEASKMAKKATEAAKKGYDEFKNWISDKKYYNDLTLEEELYAWEQASKKYSKYADIRKEADKEIYRVKKEIEEAEFNNAKKWIDERKYYNELSIKDELAAWERLQARYEKGTEKRKEADKEVYRLKNELENESFENSKKWLDDRKYYNELSIKDELAAWERLQAKYEEGTEKRKEADKEVYRLKKELANEAFENSKKWIDEEKFYNRMSLKQELNAWKRIQAQYEEGTEQRKEADKEVYTLNKEYASKIEEFENKKIDINKQYNDQRIQLEEEYAEKVMSINDKLAQDIQSLNDEYESAIKSRSDAIYNSFSLFDDVNLGEDVQGDALLTNLQNQVSTLSKWQNNLDILSGKGVSDEFMSEITAMGPSALKQLEALNAMTAPQLDEYINLWEEKHSIATNQATEELEHLRLETNEKIQQLREDADIELSTYRDLWNDQMIAIKEDAIAQLDELKNTWTSTIGDITDLSNLYSIFGDSTTYEDTGKNLVNSLSNGMVSESTNVVNNSEEISNTALSTFTNDMYKYETVGNMIIDGLINGLNENRYKLIAVVTDISQSIIDTITDVLDIHSPSRVMESIGQYTTMGFAKGIQDSQNNVNKAVNTMGYNSINNLKNAIATLSDAISMDIDYEPTIKPILDISDVEKNAGKIDAVFSRQHAMSITASTSGNNSKTIEAGNHNTYQFTQNNYSPKALSRVEIYRQTKNQFSAMKGALV